MSTKHKFLYKVIISFIFLLLPTGLFSQRFNILDFGAKSNLNVLSTEAIQAAIDSCSAVGEGTVIVPAGTYYSGTLFIKNRVNIHLMSGAFLIGSTDPNDYPPLDIKFKTMFSPVISDENLKDAKKRYKAFLFAENVENISITGEGTINGNGNASSFQLGNDGSSKESTQRPILILAVNCRKVKLENVKLKNSAYWMQSYLGCDDVHLKSISVYNHCNYNNDGIDIDSKNVLIENCIIDSDDDGICLKSHDKERFCENIIIRNCTVRSNCNAIKLGTASVGGFKNILIENIIIKSASESGIRDWQKIWNFIDKPNTGLCGISIENVDGGISENIKVNNIYMTDMQAPLFVKLGNRCLCNTGKLKNIEISNLTAKTHSKITGSITGYPGNYIENITLKNISINSPGGGTKKDSKIDLPENETLYPEVNMFGEVLPSSGLFVRHAKGIIIQNISFQNRNVDFRPSMVFNDVKQGYVYQVNQIKPSGNVTLIKQKKCKNIYLK
jgi:polygalacturonase